MRWLLWSECVRVLTDKPFFRPRSVSYTHLVYTAVSDPVVAGLAKEDGSSVGNITGSSDVLPVEEQLKMIKMCIRDRFPLISESVNYFKEYEPINLMGVPIQLLSYSLIINLVFAIIVIGV